MCERERVRVYFQKGTRTVACKIHIQIHTKLIPNVYKKGRIKIKLLLLLEIKERKKKAWNTEKHKFITKFDNQLWSKLIPRNYP